MNTANEKTFELNIKAKRGLHMKISMSTLCSPHVPDIKLQ